MSKLVSIFLVIIFSMLLAACNSQGTTAKSKDAQMEQNAPKADPAKVSEMISETSSALKTAVDDGYAWRDTGKILDKAKKLSADGDIEQAEKLAMKASQQIKMAQEQSLEQKDAGPWLFN